MVTSAAFTFPGKIRQNAAIVAITKIQIVRFNEHLIFSPLFTPPGKSYFPIFRPVNVYPLVNKGKLLSFFIIFQAQNLPPPVKKQEIYQKSCFSLERGI
jgi:hypothetical protein